MAEMLTRSVRVSEGALRLAERTLAEKGTTFSRLVRDVVDYVARTGTLPRLDDAPAASLSERMAAFEAWADDLTLSRRAQGAYASASARDLLTDALEERYA